ncbi:MAG: hypothetical protein ACI89G_003168 [Minisyncoccia bacterium]|jgi:hypothetical protein
MFCGVLREACRVLRQAGAPSPRRERGACLSCGFFRFGGSRLSSGDSGGSCKTAANSVVEFLFDQLTPVRLAVRLIVVPRSAVENLITIIQGA